MDTHLEPASSAPYLRSLGKRQTIEDTRPNRYGCNYDIRTLIYTNDGRLIQLSNLGIKEVNDIQITMFKLLWTFSVIRALTLETSQSQIFFDSDIPIPQYHSTIVSSETFVGTLRIHNFMHVIEISTLTAKILVKIIIT